MRATAAKHLKAKFYLNQEINRRRNAHQNDATSAPIRIILPPSSNPKLSFKPSTIVLISYVFSLCFET